MNHIVEIAAMAFKQLLPVSLHDGLLAMNLSPLYMFPITIVFVSALLVFVFGFTRSVTEPPTLHLLASDVKDKKSQVVRIYISLAH